MGYVRVGKSVSHLELSPRRVSGVCRHLGGDVASGEEATGTSQRIPCVDKRVINARIVPLAESAQKRLRGGIQVENDLLSSALHS
jgi:hypothetical protein